MAVSVSLIGWLVQSEISPQLLDELPGKHSWSTEDEAS